MDQQQNVSPAEMYEQYFGPAIFVPWAGVLLEYAAPRNGERVLDLACGTGIVARRVAPMVGAKGKVVALDISPGMLAVARSLPAPEGAAIEWQEGNATALALPDTAFDLVLCQQALQFFPDRTAAVREMRRVLTDEGRVVLSVWNSLHHHPLYEALFEAVADHLRVPVSAVATPYSLGDAQELRTLLDEADFQRIEIVSKSLNVHFPSPERFVQLTLLAVAAVVPEFAQDDPVSRAALIDTVTRGTEASVQRYRDGGGLTFPMSAHIAVADA